MKTLFKKWRRGWDSNPRYGFPYARFRGEYFQPLSHLSAVVTGLIVAERYVFRQSGSGRFVNGMGSTGRSLCTGNARRGIAKIASECALRHALLAAFSEERLDDGCAVGGEDSGSDFYLMVEARVGEDFETGADGAALGIVGAVDEARDTGLDDGTRAHAARLDGDIQCRIGKAIVAKTAGGFAQSDDFG